MPLTCAYPGRIKWIYVIFKGIKQVVKHFIESNMSIELTESLLKKYDFKVQHINYKLVVRLPFSQLVTMDYSESGKVSISSRLVGWNFLTGILEMKLTNAFIYSFVGMLLMAILFTFIDLSLYESLNSMYFVLAVIGWILMWCTFYVVSFYSFKQTVIQLTERKNVLQQRL